MADNYDDQFIKKHQQPKEASEGSLKYFNDLVAGREWDAQVSQLPPEWQELFLSNVPPNHTRIAQSDVSKFIDMLKTCPRKGQMMRVNGKGPLVPVTQEAMDSWSLSGGGLTPNTGTSIHKALEAAQGVLEDGVYRQKASGDIFKVYHTKNGHQVAKKLVVHKHATYTNGANDTTVEVEFVYVGRKPLHSLASTDRLSLEEAMEFGKLYGRCIICGRTLTNELSIALGIGPVCGDREFGGQFKFMIEQAKLSGSLEGVDLDYAEDATAEELEARIEELKKGLN